MPLKIVVLAKQVPDTHNVTGEAMKADGTINRSALPAIFNPEDLNALEFALTLKDLAEGEVTVVTMGPPNAAEILRESLYRGADNVLLLSDRKFAGADTLATSIALASAVKKIGDVDIVVCGRQAIDGDTAQIGPQVAQKLGFPQITYAEKILRASGTAICVERQLGRHRETIEANFPVLLTVPAAANHPRPKRAKRMLQYKSACTAMDADGDIETLQARGLLIAVMDAAALDVDTDQLGLAGSPTKVKNIESVVLASQETKRIAPDDASIRALVNELVADHILG